MQVETKLNDMFSYTLDLLRIVFLVLGFCVFLHFILKRFYKKPIKNISISKNIYSIKNKYLKKISILSSDFSSNKINNRQAYQNLSSIIRNFIYEATGIQVQNYTLSEIKDAGIPVLYELVSEYYDPEFSKISKGNILKSIEKTKGVIERWN